MEAPPAGPSAVQEESVNPDDEDPAVCLLLLRLSCFEKESIRVLNFSLLTNMPNTARG